MKAEIRISKMNQMMYTMGMCCNMSVQVRRKSGLPPNRM